MRWLSEVIFHNWHLKLLALLLSFLLWSTYTGEPQSEIGYLVPLEFRNISSELEIAGDVPTQVHIRLRGRAALLRRLTPADLAISLDLAGSPPGEQLMRLDADQVAAPLGARVVRIAPSEFRIRLVQHQPEHRQ